MFWEDDISKKLAEAGRKNTSTAWKLSNLSMIPAMVSVFSLITGIILLIVAASATFFFGETPPTNAIKGIAPIIALLLFILGGATFFFFPIYYVLVGAIALDLGDIAWGAATLVLSLPAPFYKYFKAREIREKGLHFKD